MKEPAIRLERVRKMGGTGDSPVPVGDSPSGRARRQLRRSDLFVADGFHPAKSPRRGGIFGFDAPSFSEAKVSPIIQYRRNNREKYESGQEKDEHKSDRRLPRRASPKNRRD